jgi:hypothetical protein
VLPHLRSCVCGVAADRVVAPRVKWADQDMDGGKQHEKPEHPRASANIFSALTFWYVHFPVLVRSVSSYGSTTFT